MPRPFPAPENDPEKVQILLTKLYESSRQLHSLHKEETMDIPTVTPLDFVLIQIAQQDKVDIDLFDPLMPIAPEGSFRGRVRRIGRGNDGRLHLVLDGEMDGGHTQIVIRLADK